MRDLIDPEDGENRAVRAFLMHYGAPGLTVKQQRDNMRRAGWDGFWPAWTADVDGHLTKLGAQNWLRYLFDLERARGVTGTQAPSDAPCKAHHLIACVQCAAGVAPSQAPSEPLFCNRCGRNRVPGRCSATKGTAAEENCPFGVDVPARASVPPEPFAPLNEHSKAFFQALADLVSIPSREFKGYPEQDWIRREDAMRLVPALRDHGSALAALLRKELLRAAGVDLPDGAQR